MMSDLLSRGEDLVSEIIKPACWHGVELMSYHSAGTTPYAFGTMSDMAEPEWDGKIIWSEMFGVRVKTKAFLL